MRALILGALVVAGLVSNATAQVAVGPIAITNNVNGIPITVSATSWVTVNTVGNQRTIEARIFADLIDLQKKFPNIAETFKNPADDCANRGAGKPVIRAQLYFSKMAHSGPLTIAL